jgi:hypothetical protein
MQSCCFRKKNTVSDVQTFYQCKGFSNISRTRMCIQNTFLKICDFSGHGYLQVIIKCYNLLEVSSYKNYLIWKKKKYQSFCKFQLTNTMNQQTGKCRICHMPGCKWETTRFSQRVSPPCLAPRMWKWSESVLPMPLSCEFHNKHLLHKVYTCGAVLACHDFTSNFLDNLDTLFIGISHKKCFQIIFL